MIAVKRFVVLLLLYQVVAAATRVKSPKWSSSYSVEGEIFVPFAEVVEPFKAWYDSDSSNSRIDYYDGMAKTYQLSHKEKFGASIKIVPVTTETVTNAVKCLQVNGTNSFSIVPQSVLPDLTNFKLVSTFVEDNIALEKWMLVTRVESSVNRYVMWLYKKGDIIYPLKFEMKGFNAVFLSHFDDYYIVYKNFSPVKPEPSIFSVEEFKCESFPGPGMDHIYNFNPMMEYINSVGQHVDYAFEIFKHHHNKNYDNTAEHFKRKNIFRQNLRYIHSKNRAGIGYTLKVNHLADYSNEEIQSMCGYKKMNPEQFNGGEPFFYDEEDLKKLPAEIDWRISGAVTAVKDQSICGSCWAFGTVGAVEGAYFLKHKERKSFSEQALVDCSWGFGNNGCDGGEDFRAYSWIKIHGVPLEEEYGHYLSQDGYCHIANISNGDRTKISSFVNVTAFDENALKLALVNHGPISIAIYASLKSFSFYSNGVYYDSDCRNGPLELNHAVLLVGYGTLNNEPYWLVKNSWSTHWGNAGYVLISRKNNNCGVLTSPTYVIM